MPLMRSRRRHAREPRRLAVAGLIALAGCGDAATSPKREAIPASPNAMVTSASTVGVVAVQDALDRILPTYGDRTTVELRSALEAVVDAMVRSDRAGTSAAVDRAGQLLDTFASVTESDAATDPELDVVRLALATAAGTSR